MWADNLNLPVLALIFPTSLPQKWNIITDPPRPAFKDPNWIFLSHQTAGHACHAKHMWAKILNPKDDSVKHLLKEINKYWLGSNLGCFGTSLDNIIDYRMQLNFLKVDCNHSFKELEEAYYPIDCTTENLERLTSNNLPEDLDELIEWHSEWDRMAGCLDRWKLAIIGENSD